MQYLILRESDILGYKSQVFLVVNTNCWFVSMSNIFSCVTSQQEVNDKRLETQFQQILLLLFYVGGFYLINKFIIIPTIKKEYQEIKV